MNKVFIFGVFIFSLNLYATGAEKMNWFQLEIEDMKISLNRQLLLLTKADLKMLDLKFGEGLEICKAAEDQNSKIESIKKDWAQLPSQIDTAYKADYIDLFKRQTDRVKGLNADIENCKVNATKGLKIVAPQKDDANR